MATEPDILSSGRIHITIGTTHPVRPTAAGTLMTRSEALMKYGGADANYLDRVARESITGYKEGGVELREAQEVRESHALTNQERGRPLAEVDKRERG